MTRSQIARDMAAFHARIGQAGPGMPSMAQHADRLALRKRLVAGEVDELFQALDAGNLAGIAHETADVVYALYGLAETYGFDLDAVLAEVHASNMTKIPGPDGKAVKGPGFRPPNVAAVLQRQLANHPRLAT
jgi:predicted HAD superfamily Cof-like phosphohydrolase